jgi:hypothetical protein
MRAKPDAKSARINIMASQPLIRALFLSGSLSRAASNGLSGGETVIIIL